MHSIKIGISMAVAFGVAGISQATVLTFADLNLINYDPIPEAYGDNVTGPGSSPTGTYLQGNGWTPNVSTGYESRNNDGTLSASHILHWGTGYGDLANVGFSAVPGGYLVIILTAEAGYDVLLNSFDLGGYPQASQVAERLEVRDGADNVLWSADPHTVPGGAAHSTLLPNVQASELRILVGDNWNIGISNINFDQVNAIPEPATIGILGLGAAAMLRRRRR